jgi:hypothetical protein
VTHSPTAEQAACVAAFEVVAGYRVVPEAALVARDAEIAGLRKRLGAAREVVDMTEHRARRRGINVPRWTEPVRDALDGRL